MKFYFVSLTHKNTGIVLYKFGVTNSKDIMDRFDFKYPERVGYKDFNIRPLFSVYVNDEKAIELEKYFLGRYPRVNVSGILGTYYDTDNLTGVSEIRQLDDSEYKYVLKELYKLK